MKPTLVTGANGHVGNNICRLLAAMMELVAKLTRSRPVLDRSQVDEFAGKYGYFDCAKAKRELGYTYLPARETLRRTVAWLVNNGFVTEQRRRAMKLDPFLADAY